MADNFNIHQKQRRTHLLRASTGCRRAMAFTTLELLVVMAIIVILIGLLLVGMKQLSNSSRGHSTAIMLQDAKSMFAEFKTATALHRQPPSIYRTQPGSPILPHEGQVGSAWAVAVMAPGDVSAAAYSGGQLDRYQSDAALDLGNIMSLIGTMPANKSALQTLHEDQIIQMPAFTAWVLQANGYNLNDTVGRYVAAEQRVDYFVNTSANNTGDPANGGGWQKFNPLAKPSAWTVGNSYNTGDTVTTSSGGYYVALSNNTASAANAPASSSTTWAPFRLAPSLLDAWGNPLIFVPSDGLILGVYQGAYGSGTYHIGDCVNDPASPSNYYLCIKESPGALTDTVSWKDARLRSPDRQPFFASAGSDGCFNWVVDPSDSTKRVDKSSDNVYSFEAQ